MRVFAIAGAICAITLTISTASAENKFSALLSPTFTNSSADEAFSQASHRVATGQAAVPTQQVGFRHRAQATAAGGCATGGCLDGSCGDSGCAVAGTGCGAGSCQDSYCTPHTVPNLPTSSLRQYWRSSPCNTSVWDGYRVSCRTPRSVGPKKSCLSGGCPADYTPAGPVDTGCATGGCDAPSYATQEYAPACEAGCDVASGGCDVPGGCDTGACSSF